jgi:cell division protein FtsZ
VNVIQRPGLIRIGFDDLLAALRAPNGRCVFGFGESDSDNRAHDALALALKSPLMDRGRMLAEADHVLVQIAGGPGMTLSEVEVLMHELGKHVDDGTQLLFGTAVDGRMGNRLSVTIISSLAGDEQQRVAAPAFKPAHAIPAAPPAEPPPPIFAAPAFVAPELSVASPAPEPIELRSIEARLDSPAATPFDIREEETLAEPEAAHSAAAQPAFGDAELEAESDAEQEREPEPPPRVIPPKRKIITKTAAAATELPLDIPKEKKREKQAAAKQEVLQFEPITRGRFEKSEPTIVEGQDLDVPTYLRKNVRVK